MLRFLRLFEGYRNLELALTKAHLEADRIRKDAETEREQNLRILETVKEVYKEQIADLKALLKDYEAERKRRDDSFLVMAGARPIYEKEAEYLPEPEQPLSHEERIIKDHQLEEAEYWKRQEDQLRMAAARAAQIQKEQAAMNGEGDGQLSG